MLINFLIVIFTAVEFIFCTEDFIKLLANSTSYNKHIPPKDQDGAAVEVTIQLYLITIGRLKDRDGTIELGYYYRRTWTDPRLRYDERYGNIVTQTNPVSWIWIPDIVVANAKESIPVYETSRTVFHPDGHIYFSERIKAVIKTDLDFQYYPFDTQTCTIKYESYAFSENEINLIWHETPIVKNGNEWPFTPGYVIKGSKATRTVLEYAVTGMNSTSQRFVMLHFSMQMKRTLMYYLIQTYIPSTLLIIINLTSYWIPDGAVPARITLIVTTFLSNVFILEKASAMTPQLDFMTPMQFFLIFNICVIVVSLVEYVILLSMKAEKEASKKSKDEENFDEKNVIYINKNFPSTEMKNDILTGTKLYFVNQNRAISLPTTVPHEKQHKKTIGQPKRKRAAHKIDRMFRKIMPTLFITFSLVYWIYFNTI